MVMGEFDSVMQIRDIVEGLHNFGEFSQPSSVYILSCNHTSRPITVRLSYKGAFHLSELTGQTVPVPNTMH